MSLNINKVASVKENDLGVRDTGLNSTIIVQNKLVEQYVYGLQIKSSNVNQGNVINGRCSGVIIGDYFTYNTIFGNILDSNIGIGFHDNIIAGTIENVKIGHYFNGNYIKGYVKNIITGSWIANNIVEDYIQMSTLGNNIAKCNFKGTGSSGSIHRVTINNLVNYATFEKSITSSIIENDIQDIKFTGIVHNCNIHSGLWGNTSTHQAPVIIEGDIRNKDVRKNSAGKVIIYNPADLVPETATIE